MFFIQILEKQISGFLGNSIYYFYKTELNDKDIEFYSKIMNQELNITSIINKMKKMNLIEKDLFDDFEKGFTDFNEKRIYLAHLFFSRNKKKLLTENGRFELIKELKSLKIYFTEFMNLSNNIYKPIFKSMSEFIQKEYKI